MTPARPTWRFRLWPGMVFAFIGLNFCVVGVTVYAARARGSSFAVEADYDRKALHWDDFVRRQAAQRELGWSVSIAAVDAGQVRISVADREGRPLAGAQVEVQAFHHARAGRRLSARLVETAGAYEGPIPLDAAGLWEFEVTVTRAGETFTTSTTRALAGETTP